MKIVNKHVSIICVVMAAAFWGILGIFVRVLTAMGFSSIDIVAIRCIGSALVFFLYMVCFEREKFKIHIRDLWVFMGTGIVSIVFFSFCYFFALQIMPMSVAVSLLYTAPAFVAVLAFLFLKESFSRNQMLAVTLAILGCAMVSGIAGANMSFDKRNILVGLGAGLGYALYSIFGKIATRKGYESITISFYTFLLAGLVTFPFLDRGKIAENMGSVAFWAASLMIVIVSTTLAYFVYTIGLAGMSAGMASVLACLEPVIACLISAIVYREYMSVTEWFGVLLVILSAGLSGCKGINRGKRGENL